jgi:hypothetical protein
MAVATKKAKHTILLVSKPPSVRMIIEVTSTQRNMLTDSAISIGMKYQMGNIIRTKLVIREDI